MKKTLKRTLSVLLVVVMVFGSAPLSGLVGLELHDFCELFATKAEAIDTFTEGYYTYTVDENGNATIVIVDNSISGDIIIPLTLGGYTVTNIGQQAFLNCDDIMCITIHDSITSIGHLAFQDCDSLTSIVIPDSVISIGDFVFDYCLNLTSITVDFANTVYSSDEYGVLFNKDKTNLIQYPIGNARRSYIIPNSVTSIGYSAFEKCASLISVTFRENSQLSSIGDYAFMDCYNLASITLPDSVASIGDSAFMYCFNLASITLPDSVASIGDYAFELCNALASVTFGENSQLTSIGEWAFGDCDSLTSITIPDSVTSIGCRAFATCFGLTSIKIGDSVTSIGDYAFKECTSLISVTIPNSVKIIDYGAFYNCISLTDVYYSGTEDEWNKINICENNEDLTNATIHFNSSGPSSDEPTVGEKYKNATITLDKSSFTVKEPSSVTIEGTISCPDGVEGLLMSWSFDEIDIFYTPSQTTYETISETEMRFSQTFYPKEAGRFKIYARLLNDAKAECTVTCYKEAVSAFISEHYQFVKSDKYNNFVKEKAAQKLSEALRDNCSYHWNNFISFNFFENYYDLVFAEILTGKTMTETAVSTFNKNCAVKTTTISNEFLRFLGSALNEDETKEFLTLLKSKEFVNGRETDVYQKINLIIEANKKDITESFFAKYDIIGASNKIFSVSTDYVEWAIECIYFYGAVEAYRQANEEFKTVIKAVVEKTDNKSLKNTLETFISIDEGTGSLSFAQYVLENRKTESLITMVKIFFDIFGFDGTTKFICDINLKDGTKLADKVVKIFTKEGAKVGTIAQYANGAVAGITLGMAVSELITGADDYSMNASKCTHAGDFAEVLMEVLNESEINFKESQTLENALLFDAAYNLYKDIQIYALNAMVESIYAQNGSAIAMMINKAKSTSGYISKINRYKNLNCHKHDLTELINAEYYYVDKKYSGNKVVRVACPVDIFVYDSYGNLALSIENDFIEIFDERLDAFVLDSEKYICVPLDEEFTIKIISTDEGEMDYSVFEFDENSKMSREVSKENIVLIEGKTFEGKIDNIINTDSNNYSLTVTDTQEKLAMDNDIVCVPATDIEFSESTVSLKIGQSKKLFATVSPANTNDEYVWGSSDESVATVSENGTVNAVGEGKASIVVMVNDLVYAECKVEVFALKDYTVSWIVDGVTTRQMVTEGKVIIKPANPTKNGYVFVGWTPSVPSVMPEHDITFIAVFEYNVTAEIRKPSVTTINYGDSIVLHADVTNLPSGGYVEWTASNGNFSYVASKDGTTCTITPETSGDTTFTATVYDSNGKVIDSDEQVMTAKAGFFQKVIAFFKKLFGLNKIIEQRIRF